jgi:hypothetical protein
VTPSRDPDPLAAIVQSARRRRRVPEGSICCVCGSRTDLAEGDGRVLCYAHLRDAGGASMVELDHVAGRVNLGGFLVPLEANAHRTVTDIRRILGMDGWPDARNDPLLVAAHALAGIATIEWLVARWLVDMSGWLGEVHGQRWADGAPPFPIDRGGHERG